MNLFCIYDKIDKESLIKVKTDFINNHQVDLEKIRMFHKSVSTKALLDKLFFKHEMEENIEHNPKSPSSFNSHIIKYDKKFYQYFLKYEELKRRNELNPFNSINEEIQNIFGLNILDDCVDNRLNEDENIKLIKNLYGIDLTKFDISSITQLHKLEKKFKDNFGFNINKCYLDCLEDYNKHKEQTQLEYCQYKYFEECWNILSHHSIFPISGINNIIYNMNYCFPGHRIDISITDNNSNENVDLNRLLNALMDEFHTLIVKKDIAIFIKSQLEFLSSSWNIYIKISVLLDLYWNLKTISSTNIRIHLNSSFDSSDITVPAFKNDEYYYDSLSNVNDEVKKVNSLLVNGLLLYPFTPQIKYNTNQKIFEVPEAFAEIYINSILNTKFRELFNNNFKFIGQGSPAKHKTFNDAIDIYINHFSFTKITDYYCLESIMCFNLSMKLYDYLWPLYNKIEASIFEKNLSTESLYEKYIDPIIATLFKIKSPYLRLRVVDIILQPYGHSKFNQAEKYLLSLVAIQKFLNKYTEMINEAYSIAYSAMFYYYGKRFISFDNKSILFTELEELINNDYSRFIKIDSKSIKSDIQSNYEVENFAYVWNQLQYNKKGKPRDLYSYIMRSILINNHLKQRADK